MMAGLSQAQVDELLAELPGWRRVDWDGKSGIERSFENSSYQAGLGLVIRISALAERLNHHPDITLTYPKVIVRSTTHDAGGLTEQDFELARMIDKLAT